MSEQTDNAGGDEGSGRVAVRSVVRVRSVTARRLTRAVQVALAGQAVRSISVAVVDDATIAELHQRYLGDPSPTDVLSFDLRDDPAGDGLEGEIVVSAETAARQAKRLGLALDQEILRYVVHGVLHLLGYDDATAVQRRRMRRQEDRVLADLAASERSKVRRRHM